MGESVGELHGKTLFRAETSAPSLHFRTINSKEVIPALSMRIDLKMRFSELHCGFVTIYRIIGEQSGGWN